MDDDTHFGVRCEQAGRIIECAGIDARKLEAVFVSYYEGDGAWKTMCEWTAKPEKKRFSLKDLFS